MHAHGADESRSAAPEFHWSLQPQRPGQCPGIGELSAFSRGALPLKLLKSIAEHVSVCEACSSKVSTLVSDLADRASRSERSPTTGHIDAGGPASELSSAEGPTAPLKLGQYRLLRQIGRGGMGVVYQAIHERLLREVAIKFVPVEKVDQSIDVERLKREMAAAGNLKHPNVVFATDAGEAEGIHYLVMEYVEGIDLAKLASRLGKLPCADACELIRQASSGLAHIEKQGLVHRDLKPSNLMLAADGVVKILDLGLARMRAAARPGDELTDEQYVLGTIDYVAPEQARDARHADIRADIYSLGCTLFRLLAGQPPFGDVQHGSVASKVLAHQQTPPPRLASFRQDVPPSLQAVLDKMLAKDPARRQQTAVELQTDLTLHCEGANLAALLRRADVPLPAKKSELEPTTPADGILPIGESGRRSWSRRAALLGAGLVGAAAVGAVGFARFGPFRPMRASEITKQTHQIVYPAAVGESQVTYLKEIDGIQLESEDAQLVRLGIYPNRGGRFAVSIDQHSVGWPGDFGIFLGYRLVDGLTDVPAPRFQLFWFFHAGLDERGMPKRRLVVSREQAFIGPRKPNPWPTLVCLNRAAEVEVPSPPAGSKLTVELDFQPGRLQTLAINGIALPEMATDEANAHFDSQFDYAGQMGLYNKGFYHTRFSNFDFSSLQRE